MTTSYDITTNVGKVRLKIGDTDTTDAVFTDEELTYFLTVNSNNINMASADAAEAWASKYAVAPDSEHIGDYSYSQKIVDKMLSLSKRLREIDSSTPAFDWSEPDYTSGSGITSEDD